MIIPMLKEEEIMTDHQFDAIIKMVLDLLDSNQDRPETARKLIADLLIDKQDRQAYEKPKVAGKEK
jgi:hypothetical protein